MTLDDAYAYELNFGQYIGHTLRKIADRDILYLDWMLGEVTNPTLHSGMKRTFSRNPRLVQALEWVCEARKDEIEEALAKKTGDA